MAEGSATPETTFHKLVRWFTEGQNLWNAVVSSGVTLAVLRKLFPTADWTTGTPWLVTLFTFTATWATFRVLRSGMMALWGWWSPAEVQLAVTGGKKAVLRITQTSGAPSAYSADGQIVGMLHENAANPAEAMFRCHMQFKGTDAGWSVTVKSGEWCQIVMAEISQKSSNGVLAARRGPQGQITEIPSGAMVMEFTIRATPKMKNGERVKHRVELRRTRTDYIEAKSVKVPIKFFGPDAEKP